MKRFFKSGANEMKFLNKLCSKVKKKMAGAIKKCLYVYSGNAKKDPMIWVFGAWQGKMYADNAKYLFQYIFSHHKEVRCVWVSADEATVLKLRSQGYESYKIGSRRGIEIISHAGAVFMTEGNDDVGSFLIRNSVQVQLWHGMGIKDVKKYSDIPKKIGKYDFAALTYSHTYDYWMTACEEAVRKYARAYNISPERMFVTGQPKDDTFVWLFDNEFVTEIRKSHPGCKIIVYLPTHRSFGKHECENMLEYRKLMSVNEKLKAENIVMIFKPHFHEFKNYEGMNTNMSNIIFATNPEKYGDVYEFLPACDALMTDYSGIMLGYLTSGKPIIYFPYDKEQYMTGDAGFCYSYEEVTAGPICYTWDEVVREAAHIFKRDDYIEAREKLRLRFSPYNDGKNCERVYQQVMLLLNKLTSANR